ncbi:sugar ABC transporter permease [Candidatus Sumerlaeota bacterium]|nr:sugar ABC transporter permease [Candidatus Sumerlaeota bacterium]
MNSSLKQRIWTNRHFYLFISPFFIIFGIFGLYPLIYSFVLSFMEWDGLTKPVYVGLSNFATLFHDPPFYRSLLNTIIIGLMYIPPMFFLAFIFAVILNNQAIRFRGIFRAAVFIPCITPMVVIALVFRLYYSEEQGLFNWLIELFCSFLPWGPAPPVIPWISSPEWSKPSLAILLVWRWTGYNMLMMLAGLQGISKDYYESAKIDGATWWQEMWHITLPLMRPMFIFCSIMSLLGTVYMFDEVFVMTNGGPGTSSTNFGLFLFNKSFTDFRFGYASAAAYVVASVVFIITLFILRWRKPMGEA